MPNLTRNICLKVRVTQAELDLINKKMNLAQISNREAYLRKMACDGYVVRIDFADLRELVRLLSSSTNSLNQIAKRTNETRSIYAEDIKDLQDNYEKIRHSAESIMKKFAKL